MLVSNINRWYKAAGSVANALKNTKFKCSECMAALRNSENGPVEAFKAKKGDYGSLGFVRSIGEAFGKKIDDDEDEWNYLRAMSAGIKGRLKKLGLYKYSDAEECRACLQSAVRVANYSLSDLIVYVCLLDKEYVS